MALNPRKEKCFNNDSKVEVGEGVPAKKGTVLILMTNDRTQSLHDRWKFPGGNMGKKRRPGEIQLLADMKQ